MGGIFGDIHYKFKYGSILTKIIFINIGVFLVIKIAELFSFMVGNTTLSYYLIYLLSLHSNLSYLLSHPWQPFTYMFLHEGLWHLVFNLLWLYWFGVIFLNFLDSKKFLWVYILGGLSGGLLYVLSYNIFPALSEIDAIALGASASVMAIVIAICTYIPDYTIYLLFIGPVRLKYLALATIVLDIISIPGTNAGGHIAHLGGALFGYLFAIELKRGKDITSFLRFEKKKPKNNFRVTRNRYRTRSDWEYNSIRKQDNEKLDKILDKISKSGYDSLTEEEKKFLFDSSKRS
jgi:membrane associated rhomboid family serine protease